MIQNYSTQIFYTLIALVCLLAIFFVPYAFPYTEPIAYSMSYDYGFNNRIALMLICASIFIWMIIGFKSGSQGVVFLINKNNRETTWFYRKTFIFSVLLYVLLMSFILLFVGEGVGEICESKYFLQYYYMLDHGKRGYVDFSFGYGPLMLYPPYWLHKITGFSIPITYIIILCTYHVVGMLLTYDVINRFNLDEKEKSVFFLAIFFSMLLYPLGGGLHYQLSRFALPSWLVIKISDAYCNNDNILSNRFKNIRVFLIPISICLVLLMSCEIAIAFGFVCVLFLLSLLFFRREINLFISLILVFIVLIGTFFTFPELFAYTKAFSTGYFNFPFTFNILIIALISCVFIIAWNIGAMSKKILNNQQNIFFVLTSFSLLPACFGRCDPGHLLWNGLFVLPLAYIVIRDRFYIKKRLMVCACLLYFVPYFVLFKEFCQGVTIGIIKNNIECFSNKSNYFPQKVRSLIDKIENTKLNPYPMDLSAISSIAMPFHNFDLIIQLTKDDKIADLYFFEIYSNNAINSRIKEMEAKQISYLLLPEGWNCHPTEMQMEESYHNILNGLLLAWYPFDIKYNGYKAIDPLISYINEHYVIDSYGRDPFGSGYELWRRK